MSPMHLILVAGGPRNSTRFGVGANKVFSKVKGRTLLGWALLSFLSVWRVSRVAVAVGEADFSQVASIAADQGFSGEGLVLVRSRETRMASVAAALEALGPCGDDLVAIHDSARPFPAGADLLRCLEAVAPPAGTGEGWDAAVLCEAAVDSMARIDGDRIVEGIPRQGVVRITTPLVSRAGLILSAREKWRAANSVSNANSLSTASFADLRSTKTTAFPDGLEDAVLMAMAGFSVKPVVASAANPKVTYRSDLPLAEAIASRIP